MGVILYIHILENIYTYRQKAESGYLFVCNMGVLYFRWEYISIRMMAAKHGPGIELIRQLATHRHRDRFAQMHTEIFISYGEKSLVPLTRG